MKHFAVHVGAGYFSDSNVEKLKLLCEHACQQVVFEARTLKHNAVIFYFGLV